MANDSRQLKVSPSQMLQPKREFINTNQENANINIYQMDSSVARGQVIMPPIHQIGVQDPVSATTLMNSISDITCNDIQASRKRLRDSYKDFSAPSHVFFKGGKFSNMPLPQYFLYEDVVHQIQTHQLEIDQLIAQHAERVRLEVDARRKEQSRILVSYVSQEVTRKLNQKDEEITKMRKLNWDLEERVKSLSMENQLWRDLAQTNEATANSLRSNLEQALAQVGQGHNKSNGGEAVAEDVESCCGSTNYINEAKRISTCNLDTNIIDGGGDHMKMMCRRCGLEESRVLLLPCRHLCLCAFCASSVYACPVCNSIMDGSVHVNTLHHMLPQ